MTESSAESPRRPVAWLRRFVDPSQPTGLTRTLLYAGAVALLALFAYLATSLHHNSFIRSGDSDVMNFADGHRNPVLTAIFLRITAFASPTTVTLLVIIWVLLLVVRKREKLAVVLVAGAALQGIVTFALKGLVARVRPSQALALVHESSFSFPSGHTMAATVVWGIAVYFIAKSLRPVYRPIIITLYVVAVVLVATSRNYLGAHYLSDVVGSVLLGSALLALYLGWITGHPKHLPVELFGQEVVGLLLWPAFAVMVAAILLPNVI